MDINDTTNNLYIWIIDRFKKNRVTIHSGHITFFMLLSLFPFVMFLLTMINHTEIIDMNEIRQFLDDQGSGYIIKTIRSWVDDIIFGNVSWLPFVTIITLIWSGSKGFDGLARGLDSIYNASEKRGYIKRRFFSMVYLISFVVMIISIMVLVVFGSHIINFLSDNFTWINEMQNIFFIMRYLLIFVIFLFFFVMMFRFIPYTPAETKEERIKRLSYNRTHPHDRHKKGPKKRTMRNEFPGALLASVMWILFSRLYGIYMSYQITHSSIYGNLTAFFLTLLWLYYGMMFIFIGGLFNNYSYTFGESAVVHIVKDLPGLFRWIMRTITKAV